EIQRLPDLASLKDEVLSHLASRLSDGVPQASDVATRMGMSERTFYRRLADENLSYRDVLRDAQLSLAQDLLTDSECSIAEVAFLTGFSEQSAFNRAFRRWEGRSPGSFRTSA
ncbi:MAG TPA: AraC family transcriptional regulator, partial [Hyphomonadaceae bacterium]|nr:AraC family transcriptional regulator [Hyphomonadaceae bacterium]